MIELQASVERITYYNHDNHFAVLRMKHTEKGEIFTAVGHFPFVGEGEMFELKGEWTEHPVYGPQFKVEVYRISVPATVRGIEKYLGSGLIKGIGPKTAKKLVEHFGRDTLNIIQYHPERLTEVEGIGEVKAKQIAQEFEQQRDIQDVMLFLQSNGVSPTYAVKIYKEYGQKTIQLIKENPYRLADEIFGIGFKTADKIARNMGIKKDSRYRIAAGIKHVINEFVSEGHTYAPLDELVKRGEKILEVSGDSIQEIVEELKESREVVVEETEGGKAVYLPPYYYAEKGAADRLSKLARVPVTPIPVDVEDEIEKIQKSTGIRLSIGQKEAIKKIVENGVVVVTGGPGTGKTTVINCILEVLERQGMYAALAAPTGRAAKRMTEATGRKAKTIHRLLEFSYSQGRGMKFKVNEDEPLEADVVIIDEVSMVDLLLMYNLLKAVPFGARLVLVGDVDQLPSVGAGNVLKDIIDSGKIQVVHLTEIFRQARESMIVVNAHRINRGEFPILNRSEKDFFLDEKEDPHDILVTVLELCSRRIPGFAAFDPLEDIQVLTPMRRTCIGVDNLNRELQKILNPPSHDKEEKKVGGMVFREGDKVMQIKNNYKKEVFNGDIGKIVEIDNEEGVVYVKYPDGEGERVVEYEGYEAEELVLSYAISVHKSQGSEYPVVVMPVSTQHYLMLQRNLLYTAITRAKELVVLVGTRKALAIAVNNNKPAKRYTLLARRIREYFSVN